MNVIQIEFKDGNIEIIEDYFSHSFRKNYLIIKLLKVTIKTDDAEIDNYITHVIKLSKINKFIIRNKK